MAVANTRVVNGVNTRVLHNKDYVEVSERTRILHELRRSGEIKEFAMVESEARSYGERLVWRCSALIDGSLYIGNAEVMLSAAKNTPDGTNPFECAETSAFGRMLAFAGLGTLESIASYEEVARGKPFVAVVEQGKKEVIEAKPQAQIAAPAAKPLSPLGAAIARAKETGFITGNDSAKLKASWEEQIIQIFGSLLPDAELKQQGNLDIINGFIDEHVAKSSAGGGR